MSFNRTIEYVWGARYIDDIMADLTGDGRIGIADRDAMVGQCDVVSEVKYG